MPRILVTPTLLQHVDCSCRRVLEAADFEIVYLTIPEAQLNGADLIGQLQGIDGVVAGADPYPREVLAASRLKAIARVGVGYDAIDMQAAGELGIAVTITPGTNEHSVAEQTMALLLGVYRGFPGRDQEVRAGAWKRKPLRRLQGRTMGLIGLGRIGRAVAWRAQGLGLKVIAYDPFADRDFAGSQNIDLVSFEELLGQSDIVSLHMPCTPETADLINARAIGLMRPGVVLINTARGGLVDEDALAAALASGHLAGAGLDVFKVEPLPLSSPLLKVDNVLLAPHMGGLDEDSLDAMSRMAAECLAKLFHGEWPEGCVVNDSLRATWMANGRK
ncbi:MAG TPA: phosphoglycerate dehydrogenase [Pirellulales bacterium]|jgi:phosphoglycerate dehydrogenase-like enzyme